jgi:hypothetical protein
MKLSSLETHTLTRPRTLPSAKCRGVNRRDDWLLGSTKRDPSVLQTTPPSFKKHKSWINPPSSLPKVSKGWAGMASLEKD